MEFTSDQIEELKVLTPSISQSAEGGITYLLLKDMPLPEKCIPNRIDALLCPTNKDGYPSRLFFSSKIQSSKQLNWNSCDVRILERNWFAFSWKVNRPGLRLAQLVMAHLGAFK